MNNNAISSIHPDLSLDTKEQKIDCSYLKRKNIEDDITVRYNLELSIPQLLHLLDTLLKFEAIRRTGER